MTVSIHLDRLGREVIDSPTIRHELSQWLKVCAMSPRELSGAFNDYPTMIGPAARDVLEEALCALGSRHGRPLGAVVHRADEQFIAKTLPNPDADPTRPWWWGRWPV